MDLKKTLSEWGLYKAEENCIYLYNNSYLTNKKLTNLLKSHKIKIQLDLFT